MQIQKIPFLVPVLSLVTHGISLPSKYPELQYPISSHTIPLLPASKKRESTGLFGAEVFVGSQVYALALDTGSSDTWLVDSNVNCTDTATQRQVAPDQCFFTGPTYERGASFKTIPNMNFNTSYGNGNFINGPLGNTELILGGLTVQKQEISSVTRAFVQGVPVDNLSGILGLAYPSLTSAYPGTDPEKDKRCTGNSSCGPIPYSPVLSTLFKEGLTAPVFSFALSRSARFGGVMSLGGIPQLNDTFVNASHSVIATSPIKPLGNSTIPNVYTTEVDRFVYSNATGSAGQGRFLVDTGTMPNILAKEQADAINALFDPPAVFNATFASYVVSCDAKAPELGISIGGQTFYFNSKDMILHNGDLCFSAIQASLAAGFVPILGASWLKNVLAVFDVGRSQITYVSRMYYEDS